MKARFTTGCILSEILLNRTLNLHLSKVIVISRTTRMGLVPSLRKVATVSITRKLHCTVEEPFL